MPKIKATSTGVFVDKLYQRNRLVTNDHILQFTFLTCDYDFIGQKLLMHEAMLSNTQKLEFLQKTDKVKFNLKASLIN